MSIGKGVGPDASVETILDDYDLGVDTVLADAVSPDLARLMLALLLEERGQTYYEAVNGGESGDGGGPAYETQGRDPEQVTSTDWDKIEWGTPANTVLIYEYDQPMLVRFVDSEAESNIVRLPKGSAPFSISGTTGFPAEKMYYRKMNSGDKDTQFSVLAF